MENKVIVRLCKEHISNIKINDTLTQFKVTIKKSGKNRCGYCYMIANDRKSIKAE